MAGLQVFRSGQICHKIVEEFRGQARVAHTADLFFIRQHCDGGILGSLALEDSLQRGIGAHAVIVAISADHAAVKADIYRFESRHEFQLGRDQVALYDTILLMQDVHDIQLEQLLPFSVGQRQAAHQHIQILTHNGLAQFLAHLVLAQVGQDICNAELRIFGLLSYVHRHFAAVFADDFSVHGQRDSGPLIFLNAAVIMGL